MILILGFIVTVMLFGMQRILGIFSDSIAATAAVCVAFLAVTALLYILTLRTVRTRDF